MHPSRQRLSKSYREPLPGINHVDLSAKAGIASFQETLLVQQETQVKARLLVLGLLALCRRFGDVHSSHRLVRLLSREAAHCARISAPRAAAGASRVVDAGGRGGIRRVHVRSGRAVLASDTAGLNRLLQRLDLARRSSLLEERELFLDLIDEALLVLTLKLIEEFLWQRVSKSSDRDAYKAFAYG